MTGAVSQVIASAGFSTRRRPAVGDNQVALTWIRQRIEQSRIRALDADHANVHHHASLPFPGSSSELSDEGLIGDRPAAFRPTAPGAASRMADRWRGTIPSTPRPQCQSYRRLMLVHPPASMHGGWRRSPRGVRKRLGLGLSGHVVQVPYMKHCAQSRAIALMAVNIHASNRTHQYWAGRPPFVTAMARARRLLHRTASGISSGWRSSAAGERNGRRHHVQISGRAPGNGCPDAIGCVTDRQSADVLRGAVPTGPLRRYSCNKSCSISL
jgi:hypothetical protein